MPIRGPRTRPAAWALTLSLIAAQARAGIDADTCQTALDLPLGVDFTFTHFDTLAGAQADAGVSCRPAPTPDRYYIVTVPCAGTLFVDTCGTNDLPGEDLGADTVVSIHDDACPLTSALACNNNWGAGAATCADAGDARDASASVAVTQGQRVIIRVGSFSPTNPGDPGLVVNLRLERAAQPPNDGCAAPEARVIGESFDVDVSCASDTVTDPGECPVRNDVWYAFTAPVSGVAQVDTCGTRAAFGVDSALEVNYLNSCSGARYHTACNDDAGFLCGDASDPLDAAVHFPVEAGLTYRVRVGVAAATMLGPRMVRVNSRMIAPACNLPGDGDASGAVDFNDLNRVLGNFGNACD